MGDAFEIKNYIKKAVSKEENPEVRANLEEVFSNIFLPLKEQAESSYQALWEKVLQEELRKTDSSEIYTALLKRQDFDLQAVNFYPMNPDDLQERTIDTKMLLDGLYETGKFFLYPVTVAGDYTMVQELIQTKRKFSGRVITEEDSYQAVFSLEQNLDYMEQINDLYCAFSENGKEWKTVFAPYLFRTFRVYLIETDCPEDEELKEIQPDFEEYEEMFLRDRVPVWNVVKVTEATSAYPVPSLDQMYYEHIIYRHRLHEDSNYLPAAQGVLIASVRKQEGDLVITCTEEEPRQWELYEILPWSKQPSEFPVFQNGFRKEGLVKTSFPNGVHTRAELFHFVKMLGCEEYVTLSDVFLTEEDVKADTYEMDLFIEDEIRPAKKNQTLVLQFTPVRLGEALNYDYMSYVVSRVQWIYQDYTCVGTFRQMKSTEDMR